MVGFDSSGDDFTRLRLSQGRLTGSVDLPEGGGTPAFVGQVTSGGSMLGVGKFFLVQPVSILGGESEAGVGAISSNPSASIPVYLLGPGVPATGDYLICRFVDHRWVAEKTGGTGGPSNLITLPSCFCPVPRTLRMTSADPNCNYRMFQSCTLQYGLPPAIFASLNITGPTFLSTTLFLDPISNASFYYHLYCLHNQFLLTRLYPTSPYGSPFRDGTLYTWLVGGYGNVCNPFSLHSGAPFPGSDASCSVTIDPA